MFILNLSRIVKFSLQNFVRNIWLSAVTITIIVLTLFSVTSLVMVNAIMGQAIELVKSKVDVSIYFKPAVTQEQIFLVQNNLEALSFVRDAKYVSKADALEKLRAQYQNSPLINEALKELQSNPLGDTLIVSAQSTADYQNVIDILNATPEYAALIDNKSFDDNRFIIEKLQTLSGQITGGGWAVTIFFALIAVLVIVNTIRIAVYTHRDEIGIMKLVGASNAFVRGPFLGEAAMYALSGWLITLGLTYALAHLANPYVSGLLGHSDFNLLAYLNSNFFTLFGLELLGMVLFSTIATSIALRRYLKV
ncbi:MAG: permease-like cell division protein FtsX [Patescibacteria group bacterium]